jgi:GTP-binding protein Era
VDTPGFQTRHSNALNRSLNKTVAGCHCSDVDLVLFVVEAGSFTLADAKVCRCSSPASRRCWWPTSWTSRAPRGNRPVAAATCSSATNSRSWCQCRPRTPRTSSGFFGICEKYLPEQAWWYAEDELTDRSEKFLASETVREKLFRLTGDELPYTSTVIIDKYEEEPPSPQTGRMVKHRRHHRRRARWPQGHGDRRPRGAAQAHRHRDPRTELEKLLDAKVFLELWVKVRSGWADDDARVKSFGYE